MSQKRDFSDLEDGEVSDGDSGPVAASEEQHHQQQQQQPEPKRLKTKSSRHRHQHAGIDATWGQKSVFSGGDIKRGTTTIPDGLDDDFEDDSDAMAYLAAVRKEAHAIPHLLRAPTHQIGPQLPPGFEQDTRGDESDGGSGQDYDDGDPDGSDVYEEGEEDPVAWYEDGAYIARPLSDDEDGEYDPEDEDEDDEDGNDQTPKSSSPAAIHAAYYRALLAQYASLRTLLHTEPPPDAYSRLPRYTPTEVRALTAGSTIAIWGRAVRTADPLPLQLALMSKDSVLRLLRIVVGGKFLRAGHNIPERTSRWLWALLARLPERGQLDYMEIAWIRELGKRAVLLGTSLTLMAELRAEVDSGGLGVHEGFDASESEDGFGAYDDTEVDGGVDKSLSKKDGKGSADDLEAADEPESAIPNPYKPHTNGQGKEAIPKAVSKEEDKPPGKSGEVPKAPGGMDGSSDSDHEDGEISDDGDVPMDLASNASSNAGDDPEGDLEDAKARLLAQVDAAAAEDELLTAEEERQRDARMNVRATVNMILTIVGEAYGQRDLLEFRDPFIGI